MLLHLSVTLAMGLSLVVVAVLVAVSAFLLPDARADVVTVRAQAVRRRAWIDPNEAARAAGSWG